MVVVVVSPRQRERWVCWGLGGDRIRGSKDEVTGSVLRGEDPRPTGPLGLLLLLLLLLLAVDDVVAVAVAVGVAVAVYIVAVAVTTDVNMRLRNNHLKILIYTVVED